MKLFSLFTPKWRHEDRETRIRALKGIKDDEKMIGKVLNAEVPMEIIYDTLDCIDDNKILRKIYTYFDRDYYRAGKYLTDNPERLDALRSAAIERMTDVVQLKLSFDDRDLRPSYRVKCLERLIALRPLVQDDFHWRCFKNEYRMLTLGVANILKREEDIMLFIGHLYPFEFKDHNEALHIALDKLSDKSNVIRALSLFPEEKIRGDLLERVKALFRENDHRDFIPLLTKGKNLHPIFYTAYFRTVGSGVLRGFLDEERFEPFASNILMELDSREEYNCDNIPELLEKHAGNYSAKKGVASVVAGVLKRNEADAEIIEKMASYPRIFNEPLFWEKLDIGLIKKYGLRERFAGFLTYRNDSRYLQKFKGLIDGLSIRIEQNQVYSSVKCEYCHGSGELDQHTDVGFGTRKCHYCGGHGTKSIARTVTSAHAE